MSITTRPPATAWIGVTCTDDRLRGLHRGPGMIDRLTRILLAVLRRLLVVDVVFFVLGGMWK